MPQLAAVFMVLLRCHLLAHVPIHSNNRTCCSALPRPLQGRHSTIIVARLDLHPFGTKFFHAWLKILLQLMFLELHIGVPGCSLCNINLVPSSIVMFCSDRRFIVPPIVQWERWSTGAVIRRSLERICGNALFRSQRKGSAFSVPFD